MKRLFLGHHKCGSSWLKNVFQAACDQAGLKDEVCWLGDTLPLNWHFQEPWLKRIAIQRKEFLDPKTSAISHINAYPALIADLGNSIYKAFHVIRDPRDVLVSGYFSHLNTHRVGPDLNPWKIFHRDRLKKTSNLEEGLLLEMRYSDSYLRRIDAMWQITSANRNILGLHLEDVAANPRKEFKRILEYLNLWGAEGNNGMINEIFLDGLVSKFSFKNMKKEDPGHYRNDEYKDWSFHFTPKVHQVFELLHPGLIKRLGYQIESNVIAYEKD